jgi:hypothetical protein
MIRTPVERLEDAIAFVQRAPPALLAAGVAGRIPLAASDAGAKP